MKGIGLSMRRDQFHKALVTGKLDLGDPDYLNKATLLIRLLLDKVHCEFDYIYALDEGLGTALSLATGVNRITGATTIDRIQQAKHLLVVDVAFNDVAELEHIRQRFSGLGVPNISFACLQSQFFDTVHAVFYEANKVNANSYIPVYVAEAEAGAGAGAEVCTCGKSIGKHEVHGGGRVCDTCYKDYIKCDTCGEHHHIDTLSITSDGYLYCKQCENAYKTCNVCGKPYKKVCGGRHESKSIS